MPTEDSIVRIYLSLGEAERQFNNIQNAYRLLASTWLLATLAGIGFMLSTPAPHLALERNLVCALIALSGAASILILWIVDIRVYQRLLSRCFFEGMAMEKGVKWLPQIRTGIRKTFDGRLPRMISLYYILLSAFLWLVMVGFICLFLKGGADKRLTTALPAAIILIGCIPGYLIWRKESPANTKGSSAELDARAAYYEQHLYQGQDDETG
jgi:hypothetical protein